MQSLETRIERALRDLKSIFITKKQLKNILSLVHLEKKANELYEILEKKFKEQLKENGLINCGVEGIPNKIVKDALLILGITEESIVDQLANYQKRKGKRYGENRRN